MYAQRLFSRFARPIHTSAVANAKAKAAKAKAATVKAPLPETDVNLLVTRCCGLNKFKDGEDPELKPDSEYPDWLWKIRLGAKRHYKQLDPTTKEYWYQLKKQRVYMHNLPKRRREFTYRPRPHQLQFQSRFPPKAPPENEK